MEGTLLNDINTHTDIDTDPGTGVGSGAELHWSAVWAAGVFAFSATLISMIAIWMQFKHYRKPLLQRYVVRILWMVPIFAVSSWISLVSLDMAFYVDALRDVYEAFVIYCFFGLLVSYLGGERALLIMMHGRPYTKHVFPVSLWYRELDVGDPYSFLFIKRGILQYVYVKPVLAAITMLLKSNDAYNDGSISLKSGYFWVSFVYNLSVCLSLYCLGIFFMATQADLEDFRPIPKFLCIKAVIFFSFWQGFAISVLVAIGVMSNTSPESAVAIQDFLICFEMVFASIGHWYAFSHKDYTDTAIQSARMPVYYAIRDACGIQDIVQDSLETLKGTRFTYRTFEPSEGVATVGKSRSGRISAGLRYSAGGTSKYWLPETITETMDDTDINASLHQQEIGGCRPMSETATTNNNQPYSLIVDRYTSYASNTERAPSLYFADVDEEDVDGVEELYDSSKQLEFGDYNFPAIDVHDPSAPAPSSSKRHRCKGEKRLRKKPMKDVDTETVAGKPYFGKEGWGDFLTLPESASSSSSPPTSATVEPSVKATSTDTIRDGCIDNVNGYVPELKKGLRSKKRDSSVSSHPASRARMGGITAEVSSSVPSSFQQQERSQQLQQQQQH